MDKFKEGEYILYQNGDTFELGKIKRLCDNGAFVWYHEGETAAKTSFEDMHKLENAHTIRIAALGGAPSVENITAEKCCMCTGAVCPGVAGTPHPEPSPCRLTSYEGSE